MVTVTLKKFKIDLTSSYEEMITRKDEFNWNIFENSYESIDVRWTFVFPYREVGSLSTHYSKWRSSNW